MEIDYEKIGLKAGLEIHQQLDTGKLFCNCPGYLRKEAPHFEVRRRLHKVAGETGEVDTAVEYEASLKKEFVYQGYNDTTCLIELDEEPPHMVNESALDEALKIALLLNCEIYPVSQIMRKTVINGSNTSGFQRTVLIAHDGFIETSFGKVGIDSLALEEDSARIVENTKTKSVYRLDRLGIPLVEIATAPEMFSPEQIQETALKLGEILRACKVKRGIGTIRQDVNISIKKHDRVEMKGFQDVRTTQKMVDLEIGRQMKDLDGGKSSGEVRNVLESGESEFSRPMPGKARMYPETDLPLLRISRDRLNKLKKNLPKLRADIRDELKKKGLSDELINLVLDGNLDEFEALIVLEPKDAQLVAKMVTLWRKEIGTKAKKNFEEMKEVLTGEVLEKILIALDEKKIDKNDVKKVMESVASGVGFEKAIKVEKVSDDEMEEKIVKIVKSKPGLRPNAYMGLVMAEMKGKLDAKKAMEIINRIVEK